MKLKQTERPGRSANLNSSSSFSSNPPGGKPERERQRACGWLLGRRHSARATERLPLRVRRDVDACARATRPVMRSPATPARRPSRSSPANARRHRFAGAATSGCAPRSARSLTAPATGTPGRRTSPPPPAPAATTTPARCVPSGGRGLGSYGVARKTVCPMTPARHRALQRHITVTIPTSSGPGPTSLPHTGWPAPLSPEGRPAGPSAQRLTASRHPLSRPGVDTGRLLSLPGRASEKRRRGVPVCAGRGIFALSASYRGRGPRWDAVS